MFGEEKQERECQSSGAQSHGGAAGAAAELLQTQTDLAKIRHVFCSAVECLTRTRYNSLFNAGRRRENDAKTKPGG